jgi:hypothetical protein
LILPLMVSHPQTSIRFVRARGLRMARATLALVLVLATQRELGAQGQATLRHPLLKDVMQDALAAAGVEEDEGLRLQALLELAPVLATYDAQGASALLSEIRLLHSRIPEGHSVGQSLLEGIGRGLLIGAPLAVVLQHYHDTSVERQNRDLKASTGLVLVEQLGSRDPQAALAVAALIKDSLSKGQALEQTFRLWPSDGREAMLHHARTLAAAASRPSSVVLAGIANGVTSQDEELGREVLTAALDALRTEATTLAPAEMTYVYQALMTIDRSGAERHLARLLATDDAGKSLHRLAFVRAALGRRPDLAWEALKAVEIRKGDDINKRMLSEVASALRALAPQLDSASRPDMSRLILDILPGATFGAAMNLLVALAAIDSDVAWRQATERSFKDDRDSMLAMGWGMRSSTRQRSFRDLLRLHLALSEFSTRPEKALTVLESFDDQFWSTLARNVRGTDYQGPTTVPNPTRDAVSKHVFQDLLRLPSAWLAASRHVARSDSGASTRSLHRLVRVCELLDAAIVERMNDGDGWLLAPEDWVVYLPFSSAKLAKSLEFDSTLRDTIVGMSVTVASKLKRPMVEWALCWNAVTLMAIDTEPVHSLRREAVTRAAASKGHHNPMWWRLSPLFVEQFARLDAVAASRLAKQTTGSLRAPSLVAVVRALATEID